MSDLRVASIAGADGTSPATLIKQSAAKAWANLNGTGTIALRDSLNISSVTDNGVGDYSFFFVTSIIAGYQHNGTVGRASATPTGVADYESPGTNSFRNYTRRNTDNAIQDMEFVMPGCHGDLA